MADPVSYKLLLHTFFFLVFTSAPQLTECTNVFTIVNYCKETIWPAITHSENFNSGGFTLKSGQSAVYNAPAGWNGRIWARTGCDFDKNGSGKCQTGGCGNAFNCTGPGSPPASIAEFTLGDTDYYDVSLVDGFNLPITVKAVNGSGGNCSTAGCDGDLRQNCPSQLALKADNKIIACRSACDVFNTDEYCCRGTYGSPATCLATNYSTTFKQNCPAAFSFAYDSSSLITCTGADYVVTFCASRNQTVCAYHDKQLVCNTSNGSKEVSHSWWRLLLTVFFIFSPWFKF